MKGKRIAIPASTKRCRDAATAASHTVINGATIYGNVDITSPTEAMMKSASER
jgi:hypothetical protein